MNVVILFFVFYFLALAFITYKWCMAFYRNRRLKNRGDNLDIVGKIAKAYFIYQLLVFIIVDVILWVVGIFLCYSAFM